MSEMNEQKGERVRNKETEKTVSRVRDLMKLVHPNAFPNATPPEEVTSALHELSPLLDEILKHPHDLGSWSPEAYEQYKDKELMLAGMEPKKKIKEDDVEAMAAEEARERAVREPLAIPFPQRPDVFLKVLEAYLKTGKVSKRLHEEIAAAVPEESEEKAEESEEKIEMDSTLRMFENALANPDFDQLQGLRAATAAYPVLSEHHHLEDRIDAAAQKMIEDEIATGTPDSLQRANAYLNEEYPFRKAITARLREAYEAKKQETGAEDLIMPTNVSNLESEAAAAETVEDLAKIAEHVPSSEIRTRKSIDNLAKTKFTEECKKATDIDQFKSMLGEARRFPFHDSTYGEDVRHIVEGHAKFFILAEISKLNTIDALNAFEDNIHSIRFSNDAMLTDINNEFVIAREKLRGNDLSAQQTNNEDSPDLEDPPITRFINSIFGRRQ